MFDILFDCELIQWDENGIPIPLIEFVEETEESEF